MATVTDLLSHKGDFASGKVRERDRCTHIKDDPYTTLEVKTPHIHEKILAKSAGWNEHDLIDNCSLSPFSSGEKNCRVTQSQFGEGGMNDLA